MQVCFKKPGVAEKQLGGGARQQQVACTARTMSKDRCLVVDQSGSKLYMGRVLCTSANIFKTKLETHFDSGATYTLIGRQAGRTSTIITIITYK